jgi:formylmethanofuran dehydrogenase subunit E
MSVTSLQRLVLHKLGEKPLSGYSMMKEIHSSSGQKPSFGSIYPMLDRMHHDGLVSVKQDGRKKIYTLTQKGKLHLAEVKLHREQLIGEMIGKCRAMSELIGEDPEPIISLYERLKKGEDPLAPVKANLFKVRNIIFTMSQDGRLRQHQKKINTIMLNAYKELERL